jgi:hypothetical protein
VDGILQLADGFRGVVSLRVAQRFLEQADGFLGRRVLELAQGDDAGDWFGLFPL